jgi:hypothetical protein
MPVLPAQVQGQNQRRQDHQHTQWLEVHDPAEILEQPHNDVQVFLDADFFQRYHAGEKWQAIYNPCSARLL